jgi:hypothetical protein
MANIITHNIASLPLYQDGYLAGVDVGLFIGLTAVVAAGYDQEERGHRTQPSNPANAHTASVLRAVADQLAARFRQEATR